jgi:beta-glucosidase
MLHRFFIYPRTLSSAVDRVLRLASFLLLLSGFLALPSVLTHAQTQPWMDTSLSPSQRADLLVAAMTIDEKNTMAQGAGGSYIGNVPANTRLGIPALNLSDGPAGVGNGITNVTEFPAPLTLTSAWDVSLTQQYGQALGAEQMGKGTNVVLAPMMNMTRVGRAGRNWEGYGEDPYLAAQMAGAEVQGIQSNGIIATAKHYINNEQETNRTEGNSAVDDRTMHEIYLPPFKASVHAGVGAVMCGYNKINGSYACENGPTQNTILKNELGFQGWIMSDWAATHSTVASANNGLDQEMPRGGYFGTALKDAVNNGQVPLTARGLSRIL